MKVRYDVIERDKISQLSETVTNYMDQGWVCQGGIHVTERYTGRLTPTTVFRQAMLKAREEKP